MEDSNLALAKGALPAVYAIILQLSVDLRNPKLAEFGSRLCRFVTDLKNEVKPAEILREILELVEKACSWPQGKEVSQFTTLRTLSKYRNSRRGGSIWKGWFSSFDPEVQAWKCLEHYAANEAEFTRALDRLRKHTTPEEELPTDGIPGSKPIIPETWEVTFDYSTDLRSDLHDVLNLHMTCCRPGCQHLPRLRLQLHDLNQNKDAICFEVLFAAQKNPDHSSTEPGWQETKIVVLRKGLASHFVSTDQSDSQIVDPGKFCDVLKSSERNLLCFRVKHPTLERVDEDDSHLRKVKAAESIPLSRALMTRKMTRRASCMLAYTLAKSVWQYYGSDWMDYPWTSENIHILDDDHVQRDLESTSYYTRPYFAPDFGETKPGIPEYSVGRRLWHRYPKVLGLAILLIEVAKGRPFETTEGTVRHIEDHIDDYCKSAWRIVAKEDLFGDKGESVRYRKAVESCLRFDPFPDAHYVFEGKNREEVLRDMRAILYRQVVYPLRTLLEDSGWLAETDVIEQEIDLKPARIPICTPSEPRKRPVQIVPRETVDLRSLNEVPGNISEQPSCLLHGKSKMTPASWLHELVSISWSLKKTTTCNPIRIAVLDTGCSLEAPIFAMEGQEARLRGHWKDWLEESTKPQDENGHGTEIVSLLLRVLPDAEIFVARVARDEEDLHKADELIAKAINHSATTWMADIVTMSFGFLHEVRSIKRAILKAENDRDWSIIFFAAAANDGSNSKELFPANFESVISIRGTDCAGDFNAQYDPDVSQTIRGMPLYGTLGVEVPWGWPDEGPSTLSSGCSIATPIAAGIAALIIQCVESSPKSFNDEDRKMIRTKRAITEVFHDISVERERNRRYVAPRNLLATGDYPKLAMIRAALDRVA